MPRGYEEVAFIFAILVIHDDDDFAVLNRFDGFRDGVQGHAAKVGRLGVAADWLTIFARSTHRGNTASGA